MGAAGHGKREHSAIVCLSIAAQGKKTIGHPVVRTFPSAIRARTIQEWKAAGTLRILYWSVGEFISRKIAQNGWGKGTVQALAETIQRRYPGMTGYSARNLWRMGQFFETYQHQPKLAPLVRELSWSHNLAILSRCKREGERELFLRLASRERWSYRELHRQLSGGLFERTILSPLKLSTPLAELYPDAATVFKDSRPCWCWSAKPSCPTKNSC
jgi:predicted nuclease of restriction endonuclease-like (RecB) superfamily